MQEMIDRAGALLADGTVNRVLGWKKGDLAYNPEPAFFESAPELENLIYNRFCGANLSKYMIEAGKKEGKTLVFLKPCDTYSFNQLLKEHRVEREKAYIIGIGCRGSLDAEKIKAAGIRGILEIDEDGEALKIKTLYGDQTCLAEGVFLERCKTCKGGDPMIFDERLLEEYKTPAASVGRFTTVEEIEAMKPDERFAFWQQELSRCIRCNACRNACPACSCRKCVFDSEKFDSAQKVNADSFEEKMFHIIRAFHVAGRCTDCGECSRVCPQGIPIHLLNRKYIKDINFLYGEYQAGADLDSRAPLTDFTFEDAEPGTAAERS